MKKKAIFYHAGCPVCVSAESMVLDLVDKDSVEIETVHLGENGSRIAEAESAGVQSVPALVADGNAYHINFGASIADLKG
jgi:glutaredoxin